MNSKCVICLNKKTCLCCSTCNTYFHIICYMNYKKEECPTCKNPLDFFDCIKPLKICFDCDKPMCSNLFDNLKYCEKNCIEKNLCCRRELCDINYSNKDIEFIEVLLIQLGFRNKSIFCDNNYNIIYFYYNKKTKINIYFNENMNFIELHKILINLIVKKKILNKKNISENLEDDILVDFQDNYNTKADFGFDENTRKITAYNDLNVIDEDGLDEDGNKYIFDLIHFEYTGKYFKEIF